MRGYQKHYELFESYVERVKWTQEPEGLYAPVAYIMQLGGKRMRPVLFQMACELYGKRPEEHLPVGYAIELFHNFTLVHDDIMDDAPLRRGNTTVHEKYNLNTAILSGDVMLVQVYRFLQEHCPNQLNEVITVFNHAAIAVCEGQQRDMEFEERNRVKEEEYLEMIGQKTAALLSCSLQLGAIMAGAGKNDIKHIGQFGQLMGTAFQIQDDLLDSFGDPEKFGKQVGGDILQDKKTILLIHALDNSEGDDHLALKRLLANNGLEPEEKVTQMKALYEKTGAKAYAEQLRDSYHQQAMEQLNALQAPDERKQFIGEFAEWLLYRNV